MRAAVAVLVVGGFVSAVPPGASASSFRSECPDGGTNFVASLFAFAALKADGSITAWGHPEYGGDGAPTDTGYEKIFTTAFGFAAMNGDGSITAWGNINQGGYGAPTDAGYVEVFSTETAFAALKADGSITAWGPWNRGNEGAPTDDGYEKIVGTGSAFAALKADGSITAWGTDYGGGEGAPTDAGYVEVLSTGSAFAAMKADGSITAWGDPSYGGEGAPTDAGYEKVVGTGSAFAALRADGTITAWGDPRGRSEPHAQVTPAPSDAGYVDLFATYSAFAALKADGSITAWGIPSYGGEGAPTDAGYERVVASRYLFSAIKADGSISSWGLGLSGSNASPQGAGYEQIGHADAAFAALKADGSITAWGNGAGSSGAPTDNGYEQIVGNARAMAAINADGTITAWGDPRAGGIGLVPGSDFVKNEGCSTGETSTEADSPAAAQASEECPCVVSPGPAADEVMRLYLAAFGRTPKTGGLDYWLAVYRSGVSLEEIAFYFTQSPEWARRYQGDTNSDIVDSLYQNILGRTGDVAGRAYWLAELENGTALQAVLAGFANSQEHIQRANARAPLTSEESQIYRLYAVAFDRLPSSTELNYWAETHRSGTPIADISLYLTRSGEWARRYGSANDQEIVTRFYRDVLDRTGDAKGQAHWQQAIDHGTPISTVLLAFANSPELITKTGTRP